jgi:hypothetical protein
VAAAWLLAGSAVALAAASSAVLGLLALTALVRIPLAAAAGEMSMQVISRGDPASVPVAVAAGMLLAGGHRDRGVPGAVPPGRGAARRRPPGPAPARDRAGRGD